MDEWQTFCEQYHGPVHAGRDVDNIYHCGGGLSAFAVDPQGRMSICILSQVDTYDLRQGSFREGWEAFLRAVREKKSTRLTKCRECAIKNLCGMCPANGELEAGDPETPVDFLCHVAHLRAHAFGLAVPAHGACEYCPGGVRHGELLRSAAALGDIFPPHAGHGSGMSIFIDYNNCDFAFKSRVELISYPYDQMDYLIETKTITKTIEHKSKTRTGLFFRKNNSCWIH